MSSTEQMLKQAKKIIPQSIKDRLKWLILRKELGEQKFFSQFGEDAYLQCYYGCKAWDEYGDTSKIEMGFYIDVGAYEPKRLSNTYWFYQKGWQGINIDVSPEFKQIFDSVRPRDLNIQAAISNEEKDLTLYYWGQKSVVNTISEEYAKEYVAEAGEPEQIEIQTTRLETILDKHLPANRSISFLTIDVEGHDLEVLQSNNWEKYRPELVVVEDHKLNLEEIMKSPIAQFMQSVDYEIRAWIPLSIIYLRK